MKKVVFFALFIAVALYAAASVKIIEQRVYPTVYQGTLFSRDTIATGDSIVVQTWSKLKVNVAGLDSGYIILQGKVGTGVFTTIGDTMKADGIYDRTTILPLTYLRVRMINKNDSGVVIQIIGSTF